jgi:hypothetical protein
MGTGVKRAGRGPPTPHLAPEVEGSVQLYIYSPSGPSCPVLGRNLPFTFTFTTGHLTAETAVTGTVLSLRHSPGSAVLLSLQTHYWKGTPS